MRCAILNSLDDCAIVTGTPQSHPWGLESADQVAHLLAGNMTKELLGQSTWTFLHTLAAQYPERPTRKQQIDTKQLVLSAQATNDHSEIHTSSV
jgi:hypothetical protein